ncbi:MAG: tRNA (adenosine(37)-N6)-threonylcarbamoyltransferase complex dimerization subunit type 1 TsaB [candidate division Zixibacteria bacterium]|nr:tRNA (adenosine(37)-N6)-threonylcarbamoyltransferase complex dimerization subunit type 1 TsaB [candidate division Zixibacteria bacterium]MDH3938584.1 tRNA (adenosine(37)-N6)-threonylcarbamoyltransferase complex dimerization subunit type 1 TsaB [candidate division Zixibacteria bacterium]MDH4033687.1 tRNA (adenosine(37)-N6)-threonylcarbamoyltransferase complex dimerization subunit type 1 TsaB [candidate division Zixibacteria bacterium]
MAATYRHILAIDTSTSQMNLALKFGDDRFVKLSENVGTSHGQVLMRKVQDLLNSASAKSDQIDAIVVCIGPGSFTGLRISLAAAKGMAEALGIPVVGVSLFDIACHKLREVSSDVCVVVPFKADESFVGLFSRGRVDPEQVRSVRVEQFEQFVAGRSVTTIGFELPDHLNPMSDASVPWCLEFDASDILEIGMSRLEASDLDDLSSLEPLYIQKSQAEIRYEQRRKD